MQGRFRIAVSLIIALLSAGCVGDQYRGPGTATGGVIDEGAAPQPRRAVLNLDAEIPRLGMNLWVGAPNRGLEYVETAVERVALDIRLEGFLAETDCRITIPNKFTDQGAEALWEFSLPKNSVVTGLKLDVRGVMVPGVGVDRYLAADVYDFEVGRRVDPALLSLLSEDTYRLQVFPIAPNESRTVEIRWVQPLVAEDGGYAYRFPIPAESVNWESIRVSAKSDVRLRLDEFPGKGVAPPAAKSPVQVFRLGPGNYGLSDDFKAVIVGQFEEETEWYGEWKGSTYHGATLGRRSDAQSGPEELAVIWDASHSRGNDVSLAGLAALIRTLEFLRMETVDLYLLQNGVRSMGPLSATEDGSWKHLRSVLLDIPADGGSDIGDVADFMSRRPGMPAIFATDILEFPRRKAADFAAPLLVIYSTGIYPALPTYAADLVYAGGGFAWNVRALSTEDGLTLAGRVFGESSKFDSRVFYSSGGGSLFRFRIGKQAGEGREFQLVESFGQYIEGLRAGKFFAPRSYGDRGEMPGPERHHVVAPSASLLVLESPGQYLRWSIDPPNEVPWPRSEFDEMEAKKARREAEDLQSRTPAFMSVLRDAASWFESDFSDAGFAGDFSLFNESTFDYRDIPSKHATFTYPNKKIAGKGWIDGFDEAAEEGSAEKAGPEARRLPGIQRDGSAQGMGSWRLKYFRPTNYSSDAQAYEYYLHQKSLYMDAKTRYIGRNRFFLEAAKWFADNGAAEYAGRIASNFGEYDVRPKPSAVDFAQVLESIGAVSEAIDLLRYRTETRNFYDLASVSYLAELYWLTGRRDEGLQVIDNAFPADCWLRGSMDASGTPGIGGRDLTLFLDSLFLSNGASLGSKNLRTEFPSTRRWLNGLRIKMIYADWMLLSLLVVEPSGEAVFYRNFRSESGGLYWSGHDDFRLGPDEYFNADPDPGTYKIYVVAGGGTKGGDRPDIVQSLRISAVFAPNQENEEIRVYNLEVVDRPGLTFVGEIEIK